MTGSAEYMEQLKNEVLEMSRKCYAEKLFSGTSGNLSALDRAAGRIAITPSGRPYETLTSEDIMVIDMDGNVLSGPHRPSSEWRLHTAVYRAFPEVNAVVHTHSVYATACSALRKDIPAITIETLLSIGETIPCSGFAHNGDPLVGTYAVEALKNAGTRACLLANHGAVGVGASLEKAHLAALYAENGCTSYLLSKIAGEPVPIHLP